MSEDTELLDKLQEIYCQPDGPSRVLEIVKWGILADSCRNNVRRIIGYGLWFDERPQVKQRMVEHNPADGVCDLTDIDY